MNIKQQYNLTTIGVWLLYSLIHAVCQSENVGLTDNGTSAVELTIVKNSDLRTTDLITQMKM